MNRMTFQNENSVQCVGEKDCAQEWNGLFSGPAIDRLSSYEDTGLTPESVELLKLANMGKAVAEITEFEGIPIDRLRELAEADKAGCVVVLPCKVGDTVYVIDKGKYVRTKTVYEITCKQNKYGKYFGWGICLGPGDCGTVARYRLEKLGQSWFLTREEAEKALEEMKK